jgi:3-dehydroquinate dehydratase / shikimate dehydrogenase
VFGPNRICGVVAAGTALEMTRLLHRTLRQTRTVELRLDYLRSPRERAAFLAVLARQPRRATLIATCRSLRGGGRFKGTATAQREVLAMAARAGCQWCDVEIEATRDWPAARRRRDLRPARVLLSYHNFRRTPRNLGALAHRLERSGADAIKIAAECRSIQDAARLLELARGRKNRVIVPIGEMGQAVRVLALREGSALAYAPIETATAPGQTSLDAFTRLVRSRGPSGARSLTRQTRVYSVIGDPVAHSLSPLMHNAAFALTRQNAIYLGFRVRSLRDFLAGVGPLGISGFSVTLPHKEEMLRRLDDCDPLARAIGAVNTVVVRPGGRLYGYNTDYVGVLRALERRVRLAGSCVLLLGAGGAARAAAFALARGGAHVSIWSRTPARAQKLARAAGAEVIERESIAKRQFDAIVNCTPVGLHPEGGSPLRPAELNCRIVMDMVYRPRETELLRAARRRGIETISGVDMFVAQGVAQWEIWTGLRAPEAAMRRVVNQALRKEERELARRRLRPVRAERVAKNRSARSALLGK